jgi:hypothetical protein
LPKVFYRQVRSRCAQALEYTLGKKGARESPEDILMENAGVLGCAKKMAALRERQVGFKRPKRLPGGEGRTIFLGAAATDRVPDCALVRSTGRPTSDMPRWKVRRGILYVRVGYGCNSTVIEQLRAYPCGGVGRSRLRTPDQLTFNVEFVEQRYKRQGRNLTL